MTKFRNRGGGRRGGLDPRGANQQRQSGGSRDGTPGASQGRRGGRGGSSVNRSAGSMQNGSVSHTASTPTDDHNPMNGYNSGAVEATLRQGYDAKALLYKPDAKAPATKPESPWGAKPGAMAGGKDFWLELRKQIAALQQSGGTSRGG
ncbi:hypothetical protein H2204_000341 [Knufia peltigerae]|uniref:Uncharacterized protein n=1 Tax=Knufia peltigerae TaxID=1002370 RepID=A0AA38YG83_9EURO|nr:hypothetical protein H2204_000341 [Knufia peltigerae]